MDDALFQLIPCLDITAHLYSCSFNYFQLALLQTYNFLQKYPNNNLALLPLTVLFNEQPPFTE
jgi:hypothetical protein